MAQAHGHLGHDAAGIFVHDDNPVGHHHGLFDIVGDHEDRLGGNRFAQPEFDQFSAQRLGGKHVERGERLVQAQELRLDRHGSRKSDLLAHPARKLPRISRLEPVEPDGVYELHGL